MWIHKTIPWLSCTMDGVIVKFGVIKIAIEIKSYTSEKRFKLAYDFYDNQVYLKRSSEEYAQVQTIAEVLNLSHVLLIVEWNLRIYKILVDRDLDFLWERFYKLKEVYFRFILRYNLYGKLEPEDKWGRPKRSYFGKVVYDRLINLLKKHEDNYNNDDDISYLEYYDKK